MYFFNPATGSTSSPAFLAIYAADATTLLGVSLNSATPAADTLPDDGEVYWYFPQGLINIYHNTTYVIKPFADAALTTRVTDFRIAVTWGDWPSVGIGGGVVWENDPAVHIRTGPNVPEASTALLGAAGALAMLRRRRA